MARIAPSQTRERNRSLAGSFTGWVGSLLRKLVYLTILLGAVGAGAWFYLQSQVDGQIRECLCDRLKGFYDHSLDIEIGAARRIDGEGIEIRNLKIRELGSDQPIAEIDEVFFACSTEITDLLAGKVTPRHIDVRRPRVYLTRNEDGGWNYSKLLPKTPPEKQTPTISVVDATLDFQDRLRGNNASWQLRGIDLEITPAPDLATTPSMAPIASSHFARSSTSISNDSAADPALVRIRGSMFGDHFKRTEFDALVDLVRSSWRIKGEVQQLELSSTLIKSMPAEIAERSEILSKARGMAFVEFHVEQPPAETPEAPRPAIQYSISGEIADGRFDDPRLPHPLTEIRARLTATHAGFSVEKFAARNGPATIHLALESEGYNDSSPLTLKAQTRNFELDERLIQLFPKSLQDAWKKFSPRGAIHADVSLRFDGREWHPEVIVECLNVSIAYHRFPYRLLDGRGLIQFKNGQLVCQDFQAQANERSIRVQFHVKNPGERFTGTVELASEGPVPIDEKLLIAMDHEQERLVRSLRPRGEITVYGRFERNDPTAEIDRRLEIGLRDCQIQYSGFPYPLDRIRGSLVQTNGQWEIRDLHGHNDSAYIECQGSWRKSPQEGNIVALNIVGSDVQLDDELKASLKPGLQHFWTSLRPRGTVDRITVGVRYDIASKEMKLDVTAEKWPPKQNVEGRSVSVQPTWLPYQWDNIVGAIHYRDGEMELRDLKATHGRTALQLAGTAQVTNDGRWKVQLPRFIADRLIIDQELMAALPVSFGATAVRMNFNGPVGVQGGVELEGRGNSGELPSAKWNLTLDVENGSVNCGVPLQQIRGSVQLAGTSDQRGFVSQGELDVHSLVCRDLQFTHIKGPIRIEPTRIVLGDFWSGQKPLNRAPRQVIGRVLGGTVSADAIILLGNEVQFDVQALVSEADVAQVARDLLAKKRDISGRAFASIRLQGTERGVHTFRGGGQVRLHDADIYEVPVMVALFKSLAARREERRSLTTCDVDFRIQGDRMYFDRIDLLGEAITLKGSGEIGLDRQINVNFYTILGRDELRVPGVTPLLAEASRTLFEVQIRGNMDEPTVEKKPVPAVTDALRQMFPEFAERADARREAREQGLPFYQRLPAPRALKELSAPLKR